jgi:bifunctional non-homologous end joining protein LigD
MGPHWWVSRRGRRLDGPRYGSCVVGSERWLGRDQRALVYIDKGLHVRTRTGRQVNDSLPELAGLVDAYDGRHAILDGELVACPDGKVDFYALAPRMMHARRMAAWAATEVPVTFVAFDLLHLDGHDLTGLPLVERKRLLDELHLVGPAWVVNG